MAKVGAQSSAMTSTRGRRYQAEVFQRCAVAIQTVGVVAAMVTLLAAFFGTEPTAEISRPRILRGVPKVQLVSFAFSPTSAQMATINTAGQVALRSVDRGWFGEQFLEFPDFASDLAFSPDGRLLAAVGLRATLSVWDIESSSAAPTSTIKLPIERVRRVTFSPDGRSLALTSDLNGSILIWDVAAGSARLTLHDPSPVARIAFSPDGKRLATAGRDEQSVALWNLETGTRQVFREDTAGTVMAIAFSPDGSMLASANALEHGIRLWDVKTRRIRRMLSGHTRPVNSVAFSPDGSLMATAGNDGLVGLWAVATGERRASLDAQALSLRVVAFSPDGGTLALATLDDDDIRLWDVAKVLSQIKTTATISRPGELTGRGHGKSPITELTWRTFSEASSA